MTKRKADTFQAFLNKREEAALKAQAEDQDKYLAETERLGDLEVAADEAEVKAEELEAALSAGDGSISALDLVTARAEVDRRRLLSEGNKRRVSALEKRLKITYRKDVAEIVLQVLLEKCFPGAKGYATFHVTGFKRDDCKPEDIPALVVVQRDGGIGSGGVGRATLDITWHRSPLHAKADGQMIRDALKSAGFGVASRFGGNPHPVRSTDHADYLTQLEVFDVAERIPVVRETVDAHGFDKMGELFARSIEAVLSSQATRSGLLPVQAEGLRGELVSVEEDDSYRLVTAQAEALVWKDDRHPNTEKISLGTVVGTALRSYEDEVVNGLGRCVSVKQISPKWNRDSDYTLGRYPYAFEAVYKAKIR